MALEISSTSIYSEIDKRLKDLEFKQSGKDLRTLKQMLEATQAKRSLKTHKEEQTANLGSQKQPLKHVKVPSKIPSPSTSIYSEIDRRSKDRGFKQPGEDLRLLQQILEATQAKRPLKTHKEEQTANLGSQKQPLKHVKVPSKIPSPSTSIYSEIDRRSKDRGFKQPGEDLRLLQQILEATQAKRPLKTHKEEQTANLGSQKQPLKLVKVPSKISSPSTSIYSEIDRRSKDRGLKQSGEDLRLLQQIVEPLQTKGLLKTDKLVQELIRLSSTHDEASTDYITSLRENTNPDHRYISEILLASGLLLRDLGSGTKTLFQLHPSGHPINPELLFVLEQTRARFFLSEEVRNYRNVSLLKLDRVRRKLVFDSVNEILVGKLALLGASAEPWINSGKLATKTLNAQKLLKELCTDIEQFQAKKSNSNTEDGLKNILWEDFTCQFKSWTDFNGEIYGMILNVEQMVFKDLVNEIVIEEGGILLSNQQRRRRLQKNSPVTSSTVLI
ncbi:protein LONGIFOLIA 2-like [Hibiscus syriacus]|uniref:protein LONGIFOLIA 2-like n=1 Tax=Hibiscus syriacus TaxID=106335 RepID=UPI001921FC99|nr:protein LONGIFOLIA 2-like [Hibiscus syriacus]